jgi:hypothetical protein
MPQHHYAFYNARPIVSVPKHSTQQLHNARFYNTDTSGLLRQDHVQKLKCCMQHLVQQTAPKYGGLISAKAP